MTSDDDELTWEEAAAYGSVEELLVWGSDTFHVELTNPDVVLHLAANAIQLGAWRNNSELENIHAGAYKRPGQKIPRGLSDAEMMVGNIETACLIRDHLATGDPFWYLAIEGDLFDFDRPYAGTPLTDHVTKKVLAQHRKQVKHNLWLFRRVERLIGWDRFLLGLAICDLADGIHWGSPLWPTQVDTWAETTDPAPAASLVATLRTDPTKAALDDIDHAISTGLGFAHGREQWHQAHCGNPDHAHDPALRPFLGMYASVMGIPQPWLYALLKQRSTEHEPASE